MNHEVHREVSETERVLWDLVCDQGQETIRVSDMAESFTSIHPSRARQLARTWDNEGLVRIVGDANMIAMTEYGRQVDEIVEADR